MSAQNADLKDHKVNFMGKVALTLKIMPESPDTDLNKLKNNIKSIANVQQINEKPIGFGLTCLEILFVLEDRKGIENLEEKIMALDGVASVEPGEITLL
jgi:elongation factor 1-beta